MEHRSEGKKSKEREGGGQRGRETQNRKDWHHSTWIISARKWMMMYTITYRGCIMYGKIKMVTERERERERERGGGGGP